MGGHDFMKYSLKKPADLMICKESGDLSIIITENRVNMPTKRGYVVTFSTEK